MKLKLDGEFTGLSSRVHRLVVRSLIKQLETYHPISIGGKVLSSGERGCTDRWSVISSVLDPGIRTVLDLGCAEGYFVSRLAREHGCFALGVDGDVRRLTIAQELNVMERNDRAGFMYALVTPDFVDRLPEFDLVIFLAVLHHVMYEQGLEYARDLMARVRRKTGKALIFEMGQSDESGRSWAKLLPAMGPDPHAWIGKFLQSCGFSTVVKAAETDAYKGDTRRAIYVARP